MDTKTEAKMDKLLKTEPMNKTWRPAVLIDLDGTIADCSHRRHFVEGEKKDWEKFFDPKLVAKDEPVQMLAKMIEALQREFVVIYVSGRRDSLRDVSVDWLRRHGLWIYPNLLYMRKTGDFRSDVEVKRELLAQIKEEGWSPKLAIDDRSSIIKMWREEGLLAMQVAEGDF